MSQADALERQMLELINLMNGRVSHIGFTAPVVAIRLGQQS